MRLVLATQTLDPEHAALAQTLDLVRALSARCDALRVIAQTSRVDRLPANVSVATFDASSRPARAARFVGAVERELRGGADAFLAHMIPEYVVLAAPLARPRRVPLLLWYTHWNASRTLRLAVRLGDAMLSVDRRSFPLATPKARGIGHAIDVEAFDAPPPAPGDGPLRLLVLGRTARWKGLSTAVEALRLARADGLDATLEIRGPSLTDDERRHRAEVEAAARDLPVSFEAPLPRASVPALLARVDALVSAHEPRAGATLDKAVYEAAACRRPVVTTNPALDDFLAGLPLRLRVPPRDPSALADALVALGAAPAAARADVGDELRRRVVAGHSLDHWAAAVVAAAASLQSDRGQAADRRGRG